MNDLKNNSLGWVVLPSVPIVAMTVTPPATFVTSECFGNLPGCQCRMIYMRLIKRPPQSVRIDPIKQS